MYTCKSDALFLLLKIKTETFVMFVLLLTMLLLPTWGSRNRKLCWKL